MDDTLRKLCVWTITDTLVKAFNASGGPSFRQLVIAQEIHKTVERRVATGFIPSDVVDDSDVRPLIMECLNAHPDVELMTVEQATEFLA